MSTTNLPSKDQTNTVADMILKAFEDNGKKRFGRQKALELSAQILAGVSWHEVASKDKSKAEEKPTVVPAFVPFNLGFYFSAEGAGCGTAFCEIDRDAMVSLVTMHEVALDRGVHSTKTFYTEDMDARGGGSFEMEVSKNGDLYVGAKAYHKYDIESVYVPNVDLNVSHLLKLIENPSSCYSMGIFPVEGESEGFFFVAPQDECLNDSNGALYELLEEIASSQNEKYTAEAIAFANSIQDGSDMEYTAIVVRLNELGVFSHFALPASLAK